jgi:hypothetical protein
MYHGMYDKKNMELDYIACDAFPREQIIVTNNYRDTVPIIVIEKRRFK